MRLERRSRSSLSSLLTPLCSPSRVVASAKESSSVVVVLLGAAVVAVRIAVLVCIVVDGVDVERIVMAGVVVLGVVVLDVVVLGVGGVIVVGRNVAQYAPSGGAAERKWRGTLSLHRPHMQRQRGCQVYIRNLASLDVQDGRLVRTIRMIKALARHC